MNTGCKEYNAISRRGFLGKTAKTGLALTLPAWLPRVAFAASDTRDVMISVFLRGGIDGMTLCVPYGDPNYYTNRPTLAVPRPDSNSPYKSIALTNFFSLPPSVAPLLVPYHAGDLLFVHATGGVPNNWSRSHFDAQSWMEVGKPQDIALTSGWLARHLLSKAPLSPGAPLRAIGMNYGLAQTLAGGPNTLPVPDPSNFGYSSWWSNLNELTNWMHNAYAQDNIDLLKLSAATTEATITLLQAIDFQHYTPGGGAVYPDSNLGHSLKASAALIKAGVGVEAIALDVDGWDTHNGQQPLDGYMAGLLNNLALCFAAFYKDMMSMANPQFVLVAMSEFGRTALENQSGGTDHGTGNCMMLMGPKVNGGVKANWPGLSQAQLFQQQDLAITIDYRDILAEVVQKRLVNPNLSQVFPNYTPTFHNVVAA